MNNKIYSKMSVTTALILSNVIVFVLSGVSSVPAVYGIEFPWSSQNESILEVRGAYSWFTCFREAEYWRLITFQFLHAGMLHLLFNMWALYVFGPAVEDAMGAKRFLLFYLSCGVAGALFSSLLASMGIATQAGVVDIIAPVLTEYFGYNSIAPWEIVPMVGASAGIYGVLVAVAFLHPHSVVRLVFPPISMTMRVFALSVLGIAVLTVLTNGNNAGGEAGHLGGVILSAVIMSIWRYRYLERRRRDGRF